MENHKPDWYLKLHLVCVDDTLHINPLRKLKQQSFGVRRLDTVLFYVIFVSEIQYSADKI